MKTVVCVGVACAAAVIAVATPAASAHAPTVVKRPTADATVFADARVHETQPYLAVGGDRRRRVRRGGGITFVVSKALRAQGRRTSRQAAARYQPQLLFDFLREPGCQDVARIGTEDTLLAGVLSCGPGAVHYRLTSVPAHGTASLSAIGHFTYRPAANFHGVDGFDFEACKPGRPGRCREGRVEIRVTPVNDSPVAGAVSVTTAEDTPADVGLSGSDVDGDALTYSLASQPGHGSVTVAGSSATYVPAENYAGSDSFVYIVSDGNGGTAGAPVSVTVVPVNDAPGAQDLTATTPEDTPHEVVLVAPDVEGDPVSFEVVTGPAHGTISGSGAALTYTPDSNYNGEDSFTYRASDGSAASEATVILAVEPVNDAPTAESFSIATAEDTAKELALAGADPDGDVLTYEIVGGPSHGALSGLGAIRTYTPAEHYNGPDSFTYRVSDGTLASSVATVEISVGSANDAPVALDVSATTAEDEPTTIVLAGSDAEGDPLSYEIVAPPAHGTLSGAGAERTYTPDPNHFGSDSFTFRVNDGVTSSNEGTVTLTVTEVNDAPAAEPDAKSTAEDATLGFAAADLVGNDSPGPNETAQTLTVSAVGGAVGGTVALAGGNVTFTPDPDFNGGASFVYTVDDDGRTNGEADPLSASGTVAVAVEPVNDAPVLNDGAESTMSAVAEDAVDLVGDSVPEILATGAGGDPISDVDSGSLEGIAVTSAPATNGTWQYSLDGGGNWAAPGEPLSSSTVLLLAAGPETKLRFIPNANFNGPVTLVYRAWDQTTGSSGELADATTNGGTTAFSAQTEAVTLTVTAVNDPPVAVADEYATPGRTRLDVAAPGVLGNDGDVDGETSLQAVQVDPPSHGTVALEPDGSFSYEPAADFSGRDFFTYTASDGAADSNVVRVTIDVGAFANGSPVALDGSATTAEDAATPITLSASDPEGDELTYTIVAGPNHGTLSGSGADRIYTPESDYSGNDQLTYKVNDGALDSNVATIALTVTAVNDPPSAIEDEKTVAEDTPLRFAATELVANDTAGPPNESGQALTVTEVGSPVGGTVALVAGEIAFIPSPNFNGAASFSYAVVDDGQTNGVADPKSAVGIVTIAVTPANDPPVAQFVSVAVREDEGGAITLRATDPDGDSLSYEVLTAPSHGSLTPTVGDQVTYTPVANYAGEDSFAFIASDGLSSSEVGLASVTVTPVNDAPVLDASGSPHLTPVDANATNPAGDTVADILASGAGGDPVSDVDGDPVGIAVTGIDEAGGAWQYRTPGGEWSALAGVDDAAARLLDADSRLRFIPSPGVAGDATVQFRAWDGTAGSLGGTADATVAGGTSAFSSVDETATIRVFVNNPPTATDDTATTDEDTPVTVDVRANDSDPDGDAVALTAVAQPAHGTATILDGAVRYEPNKDANGNDQFTYTLTDDRGGTATAKVTVSIAAVNDAPTARDDAEHVAEDGIVVLDPRANDAAGPREESGHPLTPPEITGAPAHGTASVNAGLVRYTPAPGYAGSDALQYEVCDGGGLCGRATVTFTVARVAATAETAPVPHGASASTDAADDAAIWVDPADPARSAVIGTNKFSDATTNGGLVVYDLAGNQLHYTNDGRMNNVDLRSGFSLAGTEVTLVTSTQRNGGTPPSPKRIWIYKLDPATRALEAVDARVIATGFEPLGDCMYHSAKTGQLYVFVIGANGTVEQWRLFEAGGLVDAEMVRTFVVSTTGAGDIAEGCVADDQLGHLYVSEEDVGIWKYSAEPDGGEARTQVDAVGAGQLTADVEGLAIAYGPGDTGYLFASSQGSSSYAVYRREGDNAFVRSFRIKDGAVDGTSVTDGIDVTSAALGSAFPNGVFVAHDNSNTPENQNFKLVPLEQIVQTGGLGSNGSCARPYADSSPWNTAIAPGAPLHADSAMHVAAVEGPLTSSPAQFTFPVYEVDRNTPRQTVTLTGWFSNVTEGGRVLVNQREGTVELPIPPGAQPADGGDAQMIMVDPSTGDEWGFSRATRDPTTGAWTGWNAYHYSTRWSGVPPYDASGRPFVPRGAGVPYLAGLVRPCELARGRIDHALAFAYDFPTDEFVYPATKSDGNGLGPPDMPEGARLQLDPALTEAELAAVGCTGHCLTIARALQVYGMYVIDNSRRPKVMVEYEGTAGWGGAVTASTVSPIPLSAFRLLRH